MSSTNIANGITTITICYIVIATTKKNNANLLLLIGNIIINSTIGNRLYTNYNINTYPSN